MSKGRKNPLDLFVEDLLKHSERVEAAETEAVAADNPYFGGSNPSQASQHNEINMLDSISDPSQDPFVTDTKSDISIYKQSIVTDVTDKIPDFGDEGADGEVVDSEFDCREPEPGPPVGAWETI